MELEPRPLPSGRGSDTIRNGAASVSARYRAIFQYGHLQATISGLSMPYS